MTVDQLRVDFMRTLTARHERLVVWKHLERALRGRGDIDAAAPEPDVAAIAADAAAIAPDTLHAQYVVRCPHVPDRFLQFFVQPSRLPQLFELDICFQPSRGSARWADPVGLARLAAIESAGIRSLRPGAEAVVSIVLHGLSASGRNRLAGDEDDIVTRGLRIDLAGAREACAVLPPAPARRHLHELVEALAAGRWDSRLARWAFLAFVRSGLGSPDFGARRLAFRARLASGRVCTMVKVARYHGRRVPPDRLTWFLDQARAEGHEVQAL